MTMVSDDLVGKAMARVAKAFLPLVTEPWPERKLRGQDAPKFGGGGPVTVVGPWRDGKAQPVEVSADMLDHPELGPHVAAALARDFQRFADAGGLDRYSSVSNPAVRLAVSMPHVPIGKAHFIWTVDVTKEEGR